MYRSIVLAYDGSPDGREALRQGVDLAAVFGAEVFLVAVIDLSDGMLAVEGCTFFSQEQQDAVEATLNEGLDYLKKRNLVARAQVRYGRPADQIALCASEAAADLIVVGHRDQKAWARWWNGSVGASVLVQAPCSLLVVVPTPGRRPLGGGKPAPNVTELRGRFSLDKAA